MKKIILRIICFVCFVVAPVIVLINTPVLKQFYCAKSKDLCIFRVYNMFRQKPSFKDDYKISDIVDAKPDKCDSLFGLYKENCVAITTKNNIVHYLEYSFKDEQDALETANDIKIFLQRNGKEYQQYKIIAQKDSSGINAITIGWGVIILFGLLISLGIVKETTNNCKGLTYKEQFNKMLEFFTVANLKTVPVRLVKWFERRVLRKIN